MDYDYYWNNVPGIGLCRNNLIYTSLVNSDTTVFVQWYYNDPGYHGGQNEVVDPLKMDEKWSREVEFLTLMSKTYPDLVPEILNIDHTEKRMYLKVEGKDFWNRANCDVDNYDSVLPDWREQMLNIQRAHRELGIWKYSMHPSSYFVVDGKLKSINYFFAYHETEPTFSLQDVESHIHSNRQAELKKYLETLGIEWNKPQPFETINKLCWNSFRTNYPNDFIEEILKVV